MGEFNELLNFIGNRIRGLRKEQELSQEDFALRCNLDRTYISDIELGKRNVSIINLHIIADTLGIQLSKLFKGFPPDENLHINQYEPSYRVKSNFSISCGFTVTSNDIEYAAKMTSNQLQELPFTLFQSIDLEAISGIVGAFFSNHFAEKVGAVINPIEKGHPDIIPISGKYATEKQLRNYTEGIEVKCTIGNIEKGSNLQTGEKRLSKLTGLTWQAHHREVKRLLGLVIDFAGCSINAVSYPILTAAFYADNLEINDWGKISGTTGRNTKVTGLCTSGKRKMGTGWIIIVDDNEYQQKYGELLAFSIENHTD